MSRRRRCGTPIMSRVMTCKTSGILPPRLIPKVPDWDKVYKILHNAVSLDNSRRKLIQNAYCGVASCRGTVTARIATHGDYLSKYGGSGALCCDALETNNEATVLTKQFTTGKNVGTDDGDTCMLVDADNLRTCTPLSSQRCKNTLKSLSGPFSHDRGKHSSSLCYLRLDPPRLCSSSDQAVGFESNRFRMLNILKLKPLEVVDSTAKNVSMLDDSSSKDATVTRSFNNKNQLEHFCYERTLQGCSKNIREKKIFFEKSEGQHTDFEKAMSKSKSRTWKSESARLKSKSHETKSVCPKAESSSPITRSRSTIVASGSPLIHTYCIDDRLRELQTVYKGSVKHTAERKDTCGQEDQCLIPETCTRRLHNLGLGDVNVPHTLHRAPGRTRLADDKLSESIIGCGNHGMYGRPAKHSRQSSGRKVTANAAIKQPGPAITGIKMKKKTNGDPLRVAKRKVRDSLTHRYIQFQNIDESKRRFMCHDKYSSGVTFSAFMITGMRKPQTTGFYFTY